MIFVLPNVFSLLLLLQVLCLFTILTSRGDRTQDGGSGNGPGFRDAHVPR